MPVTVNGKCHVCGHTWDAVVGSRSLGRGCPACGGQIVIKGKNDLATKFPEIAAEWDYEKTRPSRLMELALEPSKSIHGYALNVAIHMMQVCHF